METVRLSYAPGSRKEMARPIGLLLVILMLWSYAGYAQDQPNIHDLLHKIGMRVPAFGGLFVDEERGTLYVYMVPGQPGTLPDVGLAITEVFGDNRPEEKIQAIVGQYTFLQLEDWYGRMQPRILPLQGVSETGVDLLTNRLYVGIAATEFLSVVEDELIRLDVPLQAVKIEQVPPMLDISTSLVSKVRPLIGGLQITFKRTQPVSLQGCTLGFIAVRARDTVRGFVTNSHCSNKPFQMTNTEYYQPDIGFGGNKIGVENDNPPAGNAKCGVFPVHSCPANQKCRCSDSLFATENEDVVGRLGNVAAAKQDEPEYDENYRIISGAFVMPGQTLAKIGKSTGRTEGKVVKVCVDEKNSSGVLLLCQDVVELKGEPGDSGAPVLQLKTRGATGVSLAGILWGASDTSPRAIFSPLSGVQQDLGYLAVCQNLQC